MADNLDPELQRQLNEELGKFKDSITGLVPAMVLMTAAMKEQMAASKGRSSAEKDGKSVVDNWLKSQIAETEVTKAATATTKKYDEAMAGLNAALGNSVASLTSFGKSVMTVGGGMSKYSDTVSHAGNAIADATKGFGLFGAGIGLLAKALSKIVGTVFEYNDNMLKGTDALSKMGIIGDITTNKFREMGAQAGYSSKRLDELAGVYKEVGADIVGLGGSATEGAKSFNKLIEADDQLLEGYSRLGVTQTELNKNQANFIKLQIASGQQITERSKADGTLRKASLEYTDNLMELSSLTGMEADEIKKKQEAQRADLSYSVKQAQLQDKEIALRAEFDKTGNEELKIRADAIKTERENSDKLQDVAIAMGLSGKQLSAFNSMVATGNFNELSAGFAAGTPGILEFIKAVKDGKKAPAEFVSFMSEANKTGRERFGDAIIQSKEVGDALNISAETMRNEAKFRGKTNEEIMAMVAEEKAARDRQKQGGIDAAKDGRAAQQTTERRMQIAGDQLVSVVQGPITKAFEMFQRAMNLVAKYLAKFATWLGAPDFTSMFETPEEVAEKQQKNASILEDTNKALEKAKLAADDPKKYKEQLSEQKKLADTEIKTKTDLYRDLKKQASEEKDISKKVVLEKKAEAAAAEINEAMIKRNAIANEESAAMQKSDSRIKKDAQDQQAHLERKKIELTQESNKLEEDRIKKAYESGKITKEEADVARKELTGAQPAVDTSGRRTAASDPRLQKAEAEKSAKVDPEMLKALSEGGITDKKAQANIMAQIQAESGGVAKSESLKYTPEKLIKMFPKKFKGIEEAKEVVAQGEEAIGNKIYGGRMGNAADEGFKYRGRGLIQLTGKDNYEKFGKLVGEDLVKNPDLANDPNIAKKIAIEYFKEKQKAGTNLSDSKSVSKAVGHVDIGNVESARREMLAEAIMDKLPQAAAGGLFNGPKSGYPVMLHGNEMVIPMPDTKSLEVKKTELSEVSQEINNNTTTKNNISTQDNSSQILADLYTMMAEKLDNLILSIEDGNDHTEKLVKFSAV